MAPPLNLLNSRPQPKRVTVRFRLPHPAQQRVRQSKARFIVQACGRRFGKTDEAVDWTLIKALDQSLPPSDAWWIAPSYPMAMIGWRPMLARAQQLLPHIPGMRIVQDQYRIEFPWGAAAQCKSAHDIDGLRGPKLRSAVFDEAAYVKEEAWSQAIRPALTDLRAPARFITSPKGQQNWIYELYLRGLPENGKNWPHWESFRFPTSANPFIDPQEIEDARLDLPERVFEQEYLAVFHAESGVFRNVLACATLDEDPEAKPIHGHRYVFGIDWAHSVSGDFMVIIVYDATAQSVAFMDRMRGTDYPVQELRIKALWEKWKPGAIIAESNAMGMPMIGRLNRMGMRTIAFETTNESKVEWVEMLMLAFERKAIKLIRNPILIAELQGFQGERLPSGKVRYTHQPNRHDDCVDALGLAYWGAFKGPRPMSQSTRDRMAGATA